MKIQTSRKSIDDKLVRYLLNHNHPEGGSKAVYFRSVGFDLNNWQELAKQIYFDVDRAVERRKDSYGQRFELDTLIRLPNNRGARIIVTVWIVRTNHRLARLVTAYPKH